ncbi:beta-L-arabinofuranosidase domain-containing protein [Amycolatopsis sp. lyj-23]|uniref:beta-L-arabinofuranosidase domain-containing protein n=1 Tax=Amycolatopsis sp. lyj-23 TaxID=2789283 RepID=UPI00397E735B
MHFLDFATSGWVHPERGGWEEVPYWLRGYVDLAAVTGDATTLATVRRWIDGILATQQPDGFFGPTALRSALNNGPDFWPYLPLLQALRSWQEYTGDARIVPFLTRFFRYTNAQDKSAFDSSWVSVRWGDGLDSVFWLFNRTGDTFLLDLADKIHTYGANWVRNLPSLHNVNVAQGFREPAQYALRTGSTELTQATYSDYATIMAAYGQFAGGGFAGDENARPGFGDPRQGFETCGIVEFMASHQLLTRLTGDPVWADRCEDLAFNSLPAALDPTGRAGTTSPAPTASTSTICPRAKVSSRTASRCKPTCQASTSTAAARTTTAWAGRTSPKNSGLPPRTTGSPPPCTRRAA